MPCSTAETASHGHRSPPEELLKDVVRAFLGANERGHARALVAVPRELLTGHGLEDAPLGIIVAVIVVVEIVNVVLLRSRGTDFIKEAVPYPPGYSNTEALGSVLYTEHVYAFELAAVILLLAIVAAISLTMRRRPGLKVQNIAKQVAVNRDDRVRLVQVEAEKD